MRLALDARCLSQPLHGMARYTLNLLQQLDTGLLARTDTLLVLYNRQSFAPVPTKAQTLWIDTGIPWFSPQEPWAMSQLLGQLQPDLLHIPTYWKPYLSPCPWLMTMHDLIHLLPPVAPVHRLYYTALRQQLRQSRGLLTVSEASANALHQWLRGISVPIHVTRLGVEAAYQPPRTIQSGDYALFVGNAKPHKAFELALAATAAAGIPLRSVGVPASQQLHHQALQAVPEADLPRLYQKARLLLMPSHLEGFGLPGLEALACGTPVLATDLPVLREVLGPAARYVADHQISSWTQALQQAWQAQDKKSPDWQRLARQQLARYSWQAMAAQTAEIYRSCA